MIATRTDNVRDSILAFNGFYQPRRLLFSAHISAVLDKLSDLYATVPKTFYDNVDPDVWETEVYAGVAAVAKNVPDTADLIRTLESGFRNLYGSLDSPMPSHPIPILPQRVNGSAQVGQKVRELDFAAPRFNRLRNARLVLTPNLSPERGRASTMLQESRCP